MDVFTTRKEETKAVLSSFLSFSSSETAEFIALMQNIRKDGHLEAVRTSPQTLTLNTTDSTKVCLFTRPVQGQFMHAVNSTTRDFGSRCVGRWFSQMCRILMMESLPDEVTMFGINLDYILE